MSYEFKKINEVDILETVSDEAHVLVEEAGAIKRVPKTEVGGGGKADLVIRINTYMTNDPTTLTADKFSIESGSLEAVKNVLVAGNVPVVKVKYYCDVYDDGYLLSGSEFLCGVDKYDQNMFFDYINTTGRHRIRMDLTDTAYFGYEFYPWAAVSGGTIF